MLRAGRQDVRVPSAAVASASLRIAGMFASFGCGYAVSGAGFSGRERERERAGRGATYVLTGVRNNGNNGSLQIRDGDEEHVQQINEKGVLIATTTAQIYGWAWRYVRTLGGRMLHVKRKRRKKKA